MWGSGGRGWSGEEGVLVPLSSHASSALALAVWEPKGVGMEGRGGTSVQSSASSQLLPGPLNLDQSRESPWAAADPAGWGMGALGLNPVILS